MIAAEAKTFADVLPAPPAPPHDPRSLLLDGRAGWRAATLAGVEIEPVCGALALSPLPGTAATLADPAGSFGGLTPPAGVAEAAGRLLFLDRAAGVIGELDRCDCEVRPLPCTGGARRGAPSLRDPHGLAADRGRLYVCDTGNGRVVVVSLVSLAVTASWRAPVTAERPAPFAPWGAAVDGRGRLWVTDAANGALVAFDRDGRVVASVSGLGSVSAVAVDRCDRLYVRVEGLAPAVMSVDPDGSVIGLVANPAAVAERFHPLPFSVDALGRIDVTDFCAPAVCVTGTRALFNPDGSRASATPVVNPPAFPANGVYVSEPLDSALYRCVWHRVALRGDIPTGTSVEVATFTAETPYTANQIADLQPAQWETGQVARGLDGGEWDCLVRSGGGRYLWLRLALRSHGKATPRVRAAIVELPRVSLRRFLPAVFGADPVGADFTDRLLAICDRTLRGIESQVDRVPALFDPRSAPANDEGGGRDFLDWLASWVGVAMERSWPTARRRRWLAGATALYHARGTREGLRQQLLLFLGIDRAGGRCRPCAPAERCPAPRRPCDGGPRPLVPWMPPPLVLEHHRLRRWLFLGAGRLGDEAVLWGNRIVNRTQLGSPGQLGDGGGAQLGRAQLITAQDPLRDPFHVHAHRFSVFVPAGCARDEGARLAVERLVRRESPAHTLGQIEWVGPRFRIGVQSTIGFDSVVARLPQGVRLDGAQPLGQATVLTGGRGGDAPQIGSTARIGGGAKLS